MLDSMKPIVVGIITCTVVTLASGCRGCGDGDDDSKQEWEKDSTASTTTSEDVAKTPTPPYGWNLFGPPPDGLTAKPLDTTAFADKDLAQAAAAGCGTKVVPPIGYRTQGAISGKLVFHAFKRGDYSYPEVNSPSVPNSNTTLGSCDYGHYCFKYEITVTFAGPMKDAFYGQLISASPTSTNKDDVVFKDDTPANDWPGKKWNLKAGETKGMFPVVEVAGQTVRWIDAPGGTELAMRGKNNFIIVYAGACGVVTDTKFFKIRYFESEHAKMTELTLAQLKAEVNSFKYEKP